MAPTFPLPSNHTGFLTFLRIDLRVTFELVVDDGVGSSLTLTVDDAMELEVLFDDDLMSPMM